MKEKTREKFLENLLKQNYNHLSTFEREFLLVSLISRKKLERANENFEREPSVTFRMEINDASQAKKIK